MRGRVAILDDEKWSVKGTRARGLVTIWQTISTEIVTNALHKAVSCLEPERSFVSANSNKLRDHSSLDYNQINTISQSFDVKYTYLFRCQ